MPTIMADGKWKNPKVSGDKEACAKLAEIAKPEFKVPQRWPAVLAIGNGF